MSKKCFSHQIVPHRAVLIFSAVLSIFTEIYQKHVIYVKKCFSHQIEPHTAKQSFSIALRYLYRN